MAELKIDLRHETRAGRCIWCWEPLPEADSHTVIRWYSIELHFHHRCWPQYRACSGLEFKTPEPWTPQRIEELRIRGGWNTQDFSKRLHCNPERLRRVMSGDETAVTPTLIRELNSLALLVRFEKLQPIDWTDPRAFFCLCRHLRWSILDACRDLGSAQSTVKSWLDSGVPRSRPSTWAKLSRIADKNGFDGGMIVDDYHWTPEFLAEAIEKSGRPVSTWAALAGLTEHSIRNYRTQRDSITRNAAWCLSRVATVLGVELPPVGRVPYCRPPQIRHKPRERKKRWTPEMVALLGTMPDSEVAAKLRLRTSAVAKHRARLGIAAYAGRSSELADTR